MDASEHRQAAEKFKVSGFPSIKYFPAGRTDVAETIPDPAAEMPSDWDAEEDGDWTAPVIANPEFAKVRDYEGERGEEDFVKFINAAGTSFCLRANSIYIIWRAKTALLPSLSLRWPLN